MSAHTTLPVIPIFNSTKEFKKIATATKSYKTFVEMR
jgi:hypothetical protein